MPHKLTKKDAPRFSWRAEDVKVEQPAPTRASRQPAKRTRRKR